MSHRNIVGVVYRAVHGRDEHGDPVDAQGNPVRLEKDGTCRIGEVSHLVIGGLSASPSLQRQSSSDTSGQIGNPTKNAIQLQFGDRLVINSVRYKVISRDRWNFPQLMSGTRPKYQWVQITGTEDG